MNTQSTNFEFLKSHNPLYLQLATSAERNFHHDPNTTLIKVRQLGEMLAQDIATRLGVAFDKETKQIDLIHALKEKGMGKQAVDDFHTIRKAGNEANHAFTSDNKKALECLQLIYNLLLMYHRSFDRDFKSAEFVIPPQQTHTSEQLAELIAQNQAQERLLQEQQAKFEQELAQLKQEQENSTTPAKFNLAQFLPDENATRLLIDEQLRQAGWLVDSQTMTHAGGERPEKGKNKAIAEWQIGKQKADYVLFVGLMPVAVVEAKKQNKEVSGKIAQAERYASSFVLSDDMQGAWDYPAPSAVNNKGWTTGERHFTVPFVYSTNGRGFLHQLAEMSGIWFRDVRKNSNIKRVLTEFHSPEGLLALLKQNLDQSTHALSTEPMSYLYLRDYQERAIRAVEHALSTGQRQILLAMATGTGKTRTTVGLIYRLLKSNRFRRILFLVDRTSLGKQATDTINDMNLERSLPLSKIYNINTLTDSDVFEETRLQVATVQAMIKRLDGDNPPTIDAFDCIIVDEAHRGYVLDSEMSENELDFRDNGLYVSKYRAVLDYFDAVRIGLTATPAKHTVDIFGRPVFTYSYREAVADDWLIDYEPPIRFITKLAQKGIKLDKGEKVTVIDTMTGKVDTTELDDEMSFEVASFNRKVVTEGFNRVICQALAGEIDPNTDEKTLIFCATDRHADMVKRLLDEEFSELYGEDYAEQAVQKITGQADKVDELISRFKNEKYPSIAITVDLLTTGIDVPAICNLVFLRRVKSRILYEQMKGRATRRCDEIGKTTFRIYDAVDLYADMQAVDTMKPLVKRADISLEVLVKEILSLPTPNEVKSLDELQGLDEEVLNDTTLTLQEKLSAYQTQLTAEFGQKVMRILRKATAKADRKPELKAKLDSLKQSWQIAPDKLHKTMQEKGFEFVKTFVKTNPNLLKDLAEVCFLVGTERMPIIYTGEDKLISRTQNLDENRTVLDDDYLQSFEAFIKNNINELTALTVVAQKPKELNRKMLADLKKRLDENGYTDKKLNTAWKNAKSEDITANIVAHIRRAVIGEPLVPFEERVNGAVKTLLKKGNFTPIQKQAIERIAKQLNHEVVIDRQFVAERFKADGGDARLDKQLGGKLDKILDDLQELLWA